MVQGKEGGELFYFGSEVEKNHLDYVKGYGYWTLPYEGGVTQTSPQVIPFISTYVPNSPNHGLGVNRWFDEHFLKCFKTDLTED